MKLKVAVIAGGRSAEAAVSRTSASQVVDALQEKHDVEFWEFDNTLHVRLCESMPDVIFPVLHGPPGEDGTIQGLFEILGLPYIGSTVHGSAVSMNKHVAKLLFGAAGLPTADSLLISTQDDQAACMQIRERFGERVVFKPLNQGSALGITPLPNGGNLLCALQEARKYSTQLLIEPFIHGKEITVGILDLFDTPITAFPVTEIVVATGEWYNYENRYATGKSEHIIPPDFPKQVLNTLQQIAIDAHVTLGLRDLSRADFIVTSDHSIYLLEVNSMPGMTPTSLYPDGAKAAGIEFSDLISQFVDSAYRRGTSTN